MKNKGSLFYVGGGHKGFISWASQSGMIQHFFVSKNLEIHILGGHIDIGEISLAQNPFIAAVRVHCLQLRGSRMILLIVDITISYIETIHSVVGELFVGSQREGIAVELVVIRNIHVIYIVPFYNRIPDGAFPDDTIGIC